MGARIKEERERKKLSQAKLAKRVGMSQSALAELESGASKTTGYSAALAAELEVSALWLETGKGPRLTSDIVVPPVPPNVTRLERLDLTESDLVQMFRRASDLGRQSILAAAESSDRRDDQGGSDVAGHQS